jgi:D-threo-aldose 1-dehydrogenase
MGGTSIGDMYTRIPNAQALETVAAAYDNGIRFFDTAPWYGLGLSEARFGLALNDYPRDEYIMQTKVGRTLMPVVEPLSKWSGNLRF